MGSWRVTSESLGRVSFFLSPGSGRIHEEMWQTWTPGTVLLPKALIPAGWRASLWKTRPCGTPNTHTQHRPLVFGIFWVYFVPPPPCPNQTRAVVKGMAVTHRQAVGSHSGNISWEKTLEQSCWLDKCIRKVKKKFSPSVLFNNQSCDLIQGQQLSSKSWWSPRTSCQTMFGIEKQSEIKWEATAKAKALFIPSSLLARSPKLNLTRLSSRTSRDSHTGNIL